MAAVTSYEHAYAPVRAHSEAGWTARLVPLTVDGLVYASSVGMFDSARRKVPVPALARWLLGVGIAATMAANIAHGLGHGLAGAAVAAWPAVALVGSYELLMMVICGAQIPAGVTAGTGAVRPPPDAGPLQVEAAQVFAVDLAAGRVPSVCAIRAASYRTAASAVGTGVHGQPRLLDGRDAVRTSISKWISRTTGSSITACVVPAENAGERSA